MAQNEQHTRTDPTTANGLSLSTETRLRVHLQRPRLRGKFLFVNDRNFYVKGITYGTFRPGEASGEFHDVAKVDSDFAAIVSAGRYVWC